jgi:poly-gamma-glutamate capsule biosynthesis protein CapA/YwtB (metallophosphatase superfamily)
MRLVLAGDTMLGRGVADALSQDPTALVADAVASVMRECDVCVLNLECCISTRGRRWPAPGKPFFFRAPPRAVELLAHLGVDCVSLANNHALDYGEDALLDTLDHLRAAGIVCVGAGADIEAARAPRVLEAPGTRLGIVAFSDHPAEFTAGPGRPGIAYVDLRGAAAPRWVHRAIAAARESADAVLVTPHWGPNMTTEPVPHVRAAAPGLIKAGAVLVAGHSAHVFHGAGGAVMFDLGDFLDDYAVNAVLRNDLGLLWMIDLDNSGPRRIEALPLKLDYCHTRLAEGDDASWIAQRLRRACEALGGTAHWADGRLVVESAH